MITKDEFYEFKNTRVFQELSGQILEKVSELGAELVNREIPNINRDQFVRGAIKGMVEVLEWQPEFVEDNVVSINSSEEQ